MEGEEDLSKLNVPKLGNDSIEHQQMQYCSTIKMMLFIWNFNYHGEMPYKITCIHVLSPCQLKKDTGKHQNINAGYLWVELTAIYKILAFLKWSIMSIPTLLMKRKSTNIIELLLYELGSSNMIN